MSARRIRFALAASLLAWACGSEPAGPAPAPVEPRAAWVLEPPQLRVGDVGSLDRVVVTPPGYGVAPFTPAGPPDGFWLLDAETLAPERLPSRWIHRTRLRIRAREVGRFEWPAATAEVEAPDGSRQRLELHPLVLEVVSVLPEAPDRLTPFGVRALPAPAPPALSLLGAAVAGALATLAALAAVLFVVRQRRRAAGEPPAPDEPPVAVARAALARARAALAEDPRAAADAASLALRRYLMQRFRAPAHARTTEELAATAPPFALGTRWAGLLALLRALDAARFAPPGADEAARIAPLLAEAEAFVEATLPPLAAR
jgi:hypothetical protein